MSDMNYKGYIGSSEIDQEADILFGKLLFIKDLVTYEAKSPRELKSAFEEAVADYLEDCADQEIEPDIPFKGQFNVRLSPTLHRQLALCARSHEKSMNEYVSEVLRCHQEIS